ncbi:MAG: lauroyl acyltransferase [Stappia sp.]|uniref:lysophospholipid acyltransferase family protein n=1 Tax=Stappia sp. TaxID=1870903 RepID=UPI000C632322|nr:lauroyl acyltransferase [Stappia sp.]MAA97617.1 lauroyl acyltransferase [Stappia sp.]MBM22607.1 lauroyl acyltransferase [Stappia sp.]
MTAQSGRPLAARLRSFGLTVRHAAEWLMLRACFALVRVIPERAMGRAMGRAWRFFGPMNKRHRRAMDNLARAFPEMGEAERDTLARRMWENLGRVAAETLQLDRVTQDPSRFEFDVSEVGNLVGNGGAVVVSMHAGNWEVTTLGALELGWSPIGVYKALSNARSDTLLHSLRAPLYPGGLLPKGHETARRVLSTVRRGGRVAMLADLRDPRGAVIPFFGHDAYATTYPAMVACAAGVPLVAARVLRLPDDRFRISAVIVDVPRTGDRKADALALTQAYHGLFEQWIRAAPDQWMWIMRKWV